MDDASFKHFFRNLMTLDPRVFSVTVDYSVSLAEMYRKTQINSRHPGFPFEELKAPGEGSVNFHCYYMILQEDAWFDNIQKFLKMENVMSATIEHLFAFGVKYPNEQKERKIIAPGTTWPCSHSFRRMPSLSYSYYDNSRRLDIESELSVFKKGDRFLGAKKPSFHSIARIV